MASKENQANYFSKTYANSPDRDILTPDGCRILLQVGEKALVKLMEQGLPRIPASNSYRFVRNQVIEWMAIEGTRLGERDSSSTPKDRSESDGD